METSRNQPEIIAIASGKGGTGKTVIAACLAYALVQAGHRVLMIDADTATDGLSLFMLGPNGMNQINDPVDPFLPENTFTGMLRRFADKGELVFTPRRINRTGTEGHEVEYEALISGKNAYGDLPTEILGTPINRETFRRAITELFFTLKESPAVRDYDYVIVDTRGGFAFETTEICAIADSFIIVTEPQITSFYQDRNLIKRIHESAQEMKTEPLLRSIIVNKATEGISEKGPLRLDQVEVEFRLALEREFDVKLFDTHPVPLDPQVMLAYKIQQVPFLHVPASRFSFAVLTAFSQILRTVTREWERDRTEKWNDLVRSVTRAINQRNREIRRSRYFRLGNIPLAVALVALVAMSAFLIGDLGSSNDPGINEILLIELREGDASVSLKADYVRQLYDNGSIGFDGLDLVGVNFDGMDLSSATFRGSKLSKASFIQANLDNADLTDAELTGADLTEANLAGARLTNARMDDVSLTFAKLGLARLNGTSLVDSDLSFSLLRDADLSGANLRGASLVEANLQGANLTGADLRGADVKGADLRGAILISALVTGDQLGLAVIDSTTVLPDAAISPPPTLAPTPTAIPPTPTARPTVTPTPVPTLIPPTPTFAGILVTSNPGGWIDTGLTINAGDTLQLAASGSIRFDSAGRTADPDGKPDGGSIASSLVPILPGQILVGRIGASGSLADLSGFFVGSSFKEVITVSGKLFLGFNDGYVKQDRTGLDIGAVADNSGSFTVNILITR